MAKQKKPHNFTPETREQLRMEGINASSRTLNYGNGKTLRENAQQRVRDLLARAKNDKQRKRIGRAYANTGLIRPYYDDYSANTDSTIERGKKGQGHAKNIKIWSYNRGYYTGNVDLQYEKSKRAANGASNG